MLQGIGVPELAIILVIVLIVFGAGKLADAGGAMGKGIREFRRGVEGDDKAAPAPATAAPAAAAPAAAAPAAAVPAAPAEEPPTG
jgi:sec-independent protein translocase protein TatA